MINDDIFIFGIIIQDQGTHVCLDFLTSYYNLQHNTHFNVGTRCGLGRISGGKPLIFIRNLHAEFVELHAIVSVVVHGTDPFNSAQTFTGRSTSKCLNIIFSERTDRNFYKLVHGERTHEPS